MAIDASALVSGGSIRLRRGAKALVSGAETVLLVKERHADGTPFWTLPGGGLRSTESYVEGLRRELREELGCRAVIGDHVETVVYAHRSKAETISVYAVLDCEIVSEITPNASEGVLESRWVRPEALPPRTIPQVSALWNDRSGDPPAPNAGEGDRSGM